ncbi:MAG: thiamine-phosphate kinase [Deltaproteobacteria bacterium]|nr:thiamine-phosphate kinase [Deltaproteobacteria bacterium]
MTTVRDLGEDALIQLFVERRRAPSDVLVDNGDDAAAWRSFDGATVATIDSQVEGQHFLLGRTPSRAIGRKLAAVNLSDLAAMGATPRFALLSVCVAESAAAEILREIGEGLRERLSDFDTFLVGGNVSRIEGPLVLDLTVLGQAPPNQLLLRAPSLPGDAVFVTGTLGAARGGLEAQRAHAEHVAPKLVARLVDPTPRVAAGRALASSGLVRAACDVSDGLGRDLVRLLSPHRLGATIDALPLDPELVEYAGPELATQLALSGGEDYELLFTAPDSTHSTLTKLLAPLGVPLTRIGTVTRDPCFLFQGSPLPVGFVHFAAP